MSFYVTFIGRCLLCGAVDEEFVGTNQFQPILTSTS